MPRKDGLPTNRELQVDFTANARDVFVAAGERTLESKISLRPAFEDKPLDHFYISFTRNNRREPGLPTAIYQEKLDISPLQMSTAADLKQDTFYSQKIGNELFRDTNSSSVEFYTKTARALADTALTDSFRFGSLAPSGIEAEWTAQRTADGYRNYHVHSFKERPSKQSLVSANVFVEEAREYVDSDLFDKPAAIRLMDALDGFSTENPLYTINHSLHLRMTPDLPLNGHESQRFVESYIQTMDKYAHQAAGRVELLTRIGASEELIENDRALLDRCQQATERAKKFLQD